MPSTLAIYAALLSVAVFDIGASSAPALAGDKKPDKADVKPPQKDGLSLSVRFAKKSFHTREPIELAFQLKNESDKEMFIGDGWMGPSYQETGNLRHFELHVKADDKTALRFWSSTLTE